MAAPYNYNKATNRNDSNTFSNRIQDRAQLQNIISEVGLNPSDYIFSPLPQNSPTQEVLPTSHQSAFSNYPSPQIQGYSQVLKPQSQTLFTSGRPTSYVEQPPPPPPPPPAQQSSSNQPSSVLASLFGGSSNNRPNNQQQQSSQPPPPPPPPAQQPSSNQPSSVFASLFGGSSNSGPNNQQQQQQQQPPPPPPPQPQQPQPPPPQPSGGSAFSSLFNRPAPNNENSSFSPINNMYRQFSSPHGSPPPLPTDFTSCLQNSNLSAEHYLREINSQEVPPVRVVKPSTQNVVYKKEIRIRYLQPPTPPPPAPIIIREKRLPPKPPQSPLLIRERKPEACTPPPLTVRERPPSPPRPLEPYVIEKNLPPPPPQPRQIIIERLPTPPPKPRTVIFEKWLPYKKVKRPVLLQKAPPPEPIKPVRNVVVEYEPLKAFTVRRVIEEGVFRVDPHQYSIYNSQSHAGGDVRIVERIEDLPPPSEKIMHVLNEYNYPVETHSSYPTSYDRYCHDNLSEHIPSQIQNLLGGGQTSLNNDYLTSVSRASSTPAYRQERVLSTGYNSSRASPTIVPIQRSHSKISHHLSKHVTPHATPTRSHIDDIY